MGKKKQATQSAENQLLNSTRAHPSIIHFPRIFLFFSLLALHQAVITAFFAQSGIELAAQPAYDMQVLEGWYAAVAAAPDSGTTPRRRGRKRAAGEEASQGVDGAAAAAAATQMAGGAHARPVLAIVFQDFDAFDSQVRWW